MYSKLFWDHVRHPKNNRALSDALVGEGRYSRCGDRLKLYLKVDDGLITQAAFQARACAPVVAVASLGTELLINQELETAQKLDIFELDKQLGGLPPSKRHAYLLLLECINEAFENYKIFMEKNHASK